MFKNIFSFEGRIRRTEYGITYLVYLAINLLLQFTVESAENGNGNTVLPIILLIIFIPMLYIMFSQGAKRCHDRGNSGWYQLIPFYPLWMIFGDSDYGPNEYGPNPKGEGNYNEINEIGNKEN